MIKIIGTILLSMIAGVTYRMGGSGNYPRYSRPLGIGLCCMAELILLGHLHWIILLCGGALAGLSTSYFKKKDTDAEWWNWVIVGVAFGIAMIPIGFTHKVWGGISVRTVLLAIMVPVWCVLISNFISQRLVFKIWGDDIVEEFGRGFLAIATLPLLEIHV